MVCESSRFTKIHLRIISEWFANQQKSLRFAQESFQNGLWIIKISKDLLENHFRMIYKSLRFISEWFSNHWALLEDHLRMVCESPRFTQESFQNGLQITDLLRFAQESFQNGSPVINICFRIISEWFVTDSQWLILGDSWLFSVILDDSWWFLIILE